MDLGLDLNMIAFANLTLITFSVPLAKQSGVT